MSQRLGLPRISNNHFRNETSAPCTNGSDASESNVTERSGVVAFFTHEQVYELFYTVQLYSSGI